PFKPWEGGQIARAVYVLASLERGRQQMLEKSNPEAEKSFRMALDYPAWLGVEKPDQLHDEEAQYWLGEVLSAQGKTEAARAVWQNTAEARKGGHGSSSLFRAAALQRLGRSREAESEFSKLV